MLHRAGVTDNTTSTTVAARTTTVKKSWTMSWRPRPSFHCIGQPTWAMPSPRRPTTWAEQYAGSGGCQADRRVGRPRAPFLPTAITRPVWPGPVAPNQRGHPDRRGGQRWTSTRD